jgi:hypothetical protein
MTVTCRRSAAPKAGAGRGAGAPVAAAVSSPFSRVPQAAQNLDPEALLCPHARQRPGSAAPQELQNRLPSATSDEQRGHCMGHHRLPLQKRAGEFHD